MNAIAQLMNYIGNLFTWVVIVAPWEQALRVRLGKNASLLGAGCYLRIPFVDRVYIHTIRKRMFVIRPQVLTTLDGKTLSLSGAIGFQIDDLRKLFDSLHDAMDTVESQIGSAIAEYVSTHQLSECEPEKIERHVSIAVKLSNYGLSGQEYRITNYAVVRTYRFISGDLPAWSQGNALNTTQDYRPATS